MIDNIHLTLRQLEQIRLEVTFTSTTIEYFKLNHVGLIHAKI